ncbi:hypothetical protein GCM10010297_05510 [Streptomyces malachitofuscus]|nr:hypothetical protein GCM10010297_05510 [Streptomyces malachitofuscus]
MSDELADALRELAAQHETPPRLEAAEIRDRARRRSRRRRATVALGTAATAACVVTAAAFTLHTEHPTGKRHLPGASSQTPAPSAAPPSAATRAPAPTPSGLLDLGLHTLTVRDRVMRVDSHSFGRFPSGTRLTVASKADTAVLPLRGNPKLEEVKVPYLVELRTPDGKPVYAGALTFDAKVLAGLSDDTGWLGMSFMDARWFHDQVREGDRIELTSTMTPDPGASAAVPDTGATATEPGSGATTTLPEYATTGTPWGTPAPPTENP